MIRRVAGSRRAHFDQDGFIVIDTSLVVEFSGPVRDKGLLEKEDKDVGDVLAEEVPLLPGFRRVRLHRENNPYLSPNRLDFFFSDVEVRA